MTCVLLVYLDQIVKNIEILQARESARRTTTDEILQDDQIDLGSERAPENARTIANDL